jgi:phosphate:Na+ symporter
MFVSLLGGIGLFLLGISLLTDGLKAAAGAALRDLLTRATRRPFAAFLNGLFVTALVQSSSATAIATIGFVSAGLLAFEQSIGVIMGAALGTTLTTWMIGLLGLKWSVGAMAMPLVGVGALARLLLRGRPAAIGLALAGFGLIFVGIGHLQEGMAGLASRVQPEDLPTPDLSGRALLLVIGIAITVVLQSSTAAIVTVLTACHVGTLSLAQALPMVAGASIGTTMTSALAAIGAGVPTRRTALAHVLFNTLAGLAGFAAIPLFLRGLAAWQTQNGGLEDALVLAVFHSGFNGVAALCMLPFTRRFGRLIERLVPDSGQRLGRRLDPSVTELPEVAVEAVRLTLAEISAELLARARARLAPGATTGADPAEAARLALAETRRFLGQIPPYQTQSDRPSPRLAVVHALDHLDQLADEMDKPGAAAPAFDDTRLARARAQTVQALTEAGGWLEASDQPAPAASLEAQSLALAALRREGRKDILAETAAGTLSPEAADARLDAMRWLDALTYHAWRVVHHLGNAQGRDPSTTTP